MYQRLFQYLKTISPPPNLERAILARVRLMIQQRLVFRLTLTLISLGGVVWSLYLASLNIAGSGFYHYLSLLVSDSGLALTYWRELSLSLIESVPFAAITVFLALLSFFFWLTPRVARDAQLIYGV